MSKAILAKAVAAAKSVPTTSTPSSGSSVLIHTLNQRTDSLAKLTLKTRGYTYTDLQFTNPSSQEATYRIAYGTRDNSKRWRLGTVFNVGGKKSTVRREVGLKSNARYFLFLEREEHGKWIEQTSSVSNKDYVDVTTLKLNVSSSTSSVAALLTWVKLSNVDNEIRIFDKKPESNKDVPVKTISQKDVKISGKNNTVIVNGLSNNKTYYGVAMVKEPDNSGNSVFIMVNRFEFETSERANLTIDQSKVLATSVSMTWDKGSVGQSEADKKADFMINAFILLNQKWQFKRDLGMAWKSDSTKSFTQEGLLSGETYLFQLMRRGVDGKSIRQAQSSITTKSTDITVSTPTSIRVSVSWEKLYDKASYNVGFTPENGPTLIKNAGIATTYRIAGLKSNTNYRVDLFVLENKQRHVVSSSTFKTDRSAILTQTGVQNTTVKLQVESFANVPSEYFVQDTTRKIKTPVFTVSKPGKTDVELKDLEIGKTYKLNLFRKEYGTFTKQTWANGTIDHINVRSNDFLVTTSVASNSALITWDQSQASSDYTVKIFDKSPSSTTDPKFTYTGDQIKTSDGEHTVVVSGLVKNTKYYGVISGNEKNEAGVETQVDMKSFDFTTSTAAVFKLGKYFASYVNFSWSAGNVKESDGVSEFRIQYYDYSTKKWNGDMNWQPDTNNTAVITGLKPGNKYRFDLHRLGVNGKASRQATTDVTMRTSKLEVESVSTQQITAKWAPIYANAQYQLTYTPSGGKPVVFGGAPLAATSASIKGLSAGTDYKLELYVIENGKPVGVSTSALGSSVNVTTGSNSMMYGMIATVVAIILALLFMKMKKRS